MKDLFTPVTRDERQEQCKRAWLLNKGKGTIEACTGFGKTRCALNCLKAVLSKYPAIRVLVVVPTELLKNQWVSIIDKEALGLNVEVQIVNTIAKNGYECDFLIIDEIHRTAANTLQFIFSRVRYKLILGLTATLERLDGRHTIIEKYCPVVDSVPIEVAKANGWVSDFVEYQVVITVDDIEEYRSQNREFTEHFEFFNFDFELAMSMVGKDGLKNRLNYRNQICSSSDKASLSDCLKQITYHSVGFMRTMQARKKFIYNHPAKLQIAREIIAHRLDKKIITFSANTKMAEKIGIGYVYTGKEGKKKNRITLEEFATLSSGVINSCKLAIEGFDCPGLSVGIMLGIDSSSTKSTQAAGRVIRKEESKYSEIFTLVLEDTVEQEWFRKSHQNSTYITIDVENLRKLLNGETWEPYKKKLQNFTYRF